MCFLYFYFIYFCFFINITKNFNKQKINFYKGDNLNLNLNYKKKICHSSIKLREKNVEIYVLVR